MQIEQQRLQVGRLHPGVEFFGQYVGVDDVVAALGAVPVSVDHIQRVPAGDVPQAVVVSLVEVVRALKDHVGFFLEGDRLPPHHGAVPVQVYIHAVGIDVHIVEAVVEGAAVGAGFGAGKLGDALRDLYPEGNTGMREAVLTEVNGCIHALPGNGFPCLDGKALRPGFDFLRAGAIRHSEGYLSFTAAYTDGVYGITA